MKWQQDKGDQPDLFDEALKASLHLDLTGGGGTKTGKYEAQQIRAALDQQRALSEHLMEEITSSANLNLAYKRVKANKGAAGVDGMTVQDLRRWLADNRDEFVKALLYGTYKPGPVKGVKIPKPGGGERQLGIPNVVDRLVQQAILQILQPIFDATFSQHSYGFRPGRSAHDALAASKEHVADGYDIVVDLDLEKFFDRVNHDILMGRLAQRIGDKRLLKIIRRFLQAGMMESGLDVKRYQGTPQGGPLSPLLANLLLDDFDKELEKRGHRFVRYADDCNIYLRSMRAGERVLSSVTVFLEKRLRLKVNQAKSRVAPVQERSFLGYRLLPEGQLIIAPKSLKRAKDRIRQITNRNRGIPFDRVIGEVNNFLTGWVTYFQMSERCGPFQKLESWIRRRLRCFRIRQCKRARSLAAFLKRQGVTARRAWEAAAASRGWWRKAMLPPVQHAMSNDWFEKAGLKSLTKQYFTLQTSENRLGT